MIDRFLLERLPKNRSMTPESGDVNLSWPSYNFVEDFAFELVGFSGECFRLGKFQDWLALKELMEVLGEELDLIPVFSSQGRSLLEMVSVVTLRDALGDAETSNGFWTMLSSLGSRKSYLCLAFILQEHDFSHINIPGVWEIHSESILLRESQYCAELLLQTR